MFLQAYGAAAVIVAMAIVLGRAICSLGGSHQRWYAAPVVGLAAAIVLESAAIKLPGRAVTAVVIGVIALAIAAAVLIRNRGAAAREREAARIAPGRRQRVSFQDDVLIGVPVIGASLPFIANGRIGIPGVSVDNDQATHLLWAEGLRSATMAKLWPPSAGYPLGPHSLIATVGTATATPLDMVLTGLLLATVPLTALVGAGLLSQESPWRRTAVGLFCSLTYLVAAYYAEGAFKETLMAMLLLGFVVHLTQVSADWSTARGMTRVWLVVPAVLLAVCSVYAYSYIGLTWFGASLVLWALASWLLRPRAVRDWFSDGRWRLDARWIAASVALAIILLLPVIRPALDFFRGYGLSPAGGNAIATTNLGNLYGRLSPYEMFGVWWSPDFRSAPTNVFHAGELSALTLLVVVYGAAWAIRRRKLLLPAAVGACLLIWWRTDHTQSPYVSAKALIIGAPLVMGLALGGLLARRDGPRSHAFVRFAAAAVFCSFAAYSSYDVLRHQPVEAPETAREMTTFERTIRGSPVLFLGNDEYASWQLRPSAVSALSGFEPSLGAATARTNKPFVVGQEVDFDSVNPSDLDRFRWVITPSGDYSSSPPANFRLVVRAPLFHLWERTGPTAPREVIESPGSPGAILNCRSAAGKQLQVAHGHAGIMATPVTEQKPIFIPAGGTATVPLALPVGQWELSVQYISSFNFEISAQGRRWAMAAYLGRGGPYFAVGAVTGQGARSPVNLMVKVERPSFLTGRLDNLFTYISAIAATRIPDERETVPLSHACGKYVDWYRLG